MCQPTTDAGLLALFTDELPTPTMAIVIETAEVYGDCANALRRGEVWQPESWEPLTDAPGLAELYASTWSIVEHEMRAVVNTSYEGDPSRD